MAQRNWRGLDRKRIALLHVAKKQLGLDEDSYRAILRRFGGVDSAADLNGVGFETVMIRLEKLGFRSTWQKRTFGDRNGMATPAQVDYARRLWEQYDPNDAGETHLNAWLHKYHHVSAMRFVSAQKIEAIIPALMVNRRQD